MTVMEDRPLSLLVLLFLGYASLSLARRSLQDVYPLIPGMMKATDSATHLGTILSFQTAGYTFTKLISGILMDQINPFNAFMTTLVCTAITLFLMSTSTNWFVWLILSTISGLSLGISWPSVAKILRTSVSSSELATWWGIISASTNLAGGLGPWIALSVFTVATPTMGEQAWKASLLVVGTGCATCALLAFVHRRFAHKTSPQKTHFDSTVSSYSSNGCTPLLGNGKSEQGTPCIDLTVSEERNVCKQGLQSERNNEIPSDTTTLTHRSAILSLAARWRKLFHVLSPAHRAVLCCSAFVHLSSTFLRYVISNWFPVMLLQHESSVYSRSAINTLVSCYELGGILGNLAAGVLSDAVICRNTKWLNPRIPMILIQMSLASVTLLCASYMVATDMALWLLLIAGFILGLTVFGSISLCGVLAVELAPPSLSGTCHAFSAFAANVGTFLACYPVTRLSLHLGWPGAFALCGTFCGLSLLPLYVVSYRTSHPQLSK